MSLEQEEELERKGYCTAEYIARLFNLSVRRVQQFRSEGALVTEKTPLGMRYHLLKSLTQWVKWFLLRLDARSEKMRAETAYADCQEKRAQLLDLQLRKRKGELHEARHIRAIWTQNLVEIRAAIRAIPGRTAVELSLCAGPNEIAATLRRAIDETLHQLANREYDPEEFRKLVEAEGDYIADLDDEDEEGTDEKTQQK